MLKITILVQRETICSGLFSVKETMRQAVEGTSLGPRLPTPCGCRRSSRSGPGPHAGSVHVYTYELFVHSLTFVLCSRNVRGRCVQEAHRSEGDTVPRTQGGRETQHGQEPVHVRLGRGGKQDLLLGALCRIPKDKKEKIPHMISPVYYELKDTKCVVVGVR